MLLGPDNQIIEKSYLIKRAPFRNRENGFNLPRYNLLRFLFFRQLLLKKL